MPDLKEVYERLEKNKKRRKEIAKMLTDELEHDSRYKELKEDLKTQREEKKAIEQTVRAKTPGFTELEEIKLDIQTDQEVLSDLALNMYVKNETVEIRDEFDQPWYPTFKVTFKKGNT